MEYKYNAIILGKADVGETDRIYTVYTRENGRMSLLAKGVRKPSARLAGNLEPLTQAEIFVARSRGRGNVTGAIGMESFPNVKKDIRKLEKAFSYLRLFDKLVTQEEKDEEIFSLLEGYLLSLEKADSGEEERLEVLSLGFIFKLLEKMGYGLEFKKCVRCRKKLPPGGNFLGIERGGTLCPVCAAGETKIIRISDESVKLARIFQANRMENLKKVRVSAKTLRDFRQATEEFFRWAI